jgi:hypothetical protein
VALRLGGPDPLFSRVEEFGFMLALEVRFDFSCCQCGHALGVTLRCEGHGLAGNPMTIVSVPCPTCKEPNLIHFTPEDGRLHRVTRPRYYDRIPDMSRN